MTSVKRKHQRLTDTIVKNAKPGRYGDRRGGHGLTLLAKKTPSGRMSKSWSQQIRIKGKVVNIGLGSYPFVTLAMARDKARDNAQRVSRGEDILKPAPKVPTIAEAFATVIKAREDGWKSEKTKKSWYISLGYCAAISSKPVSAVDEDDVLDILTPIWHAKSATAKRVRNNLSTVMEWPSIKKYRNDNPANPGIIRSLGKQTPPVHHKSLDYQKLGDALAMIRDADIWWAAKYCFIFLVLTGVRSGEARMATWEEVDLDTRIWTIPADRMKNSSEHKVPISLQAMEILLHARDRTGRTDGVIFPPERGGEHMGSDILSKITLKLGIPAVPHGSRSSFRNWAGGDPLIAQPAAEMVLAHRQSNEIVSAYLTSDFLEHRGPIMQAWADFLSDFMGQVIATTDRENYPPK